MTAAEKEYGGALYDLAVEEHCEDAVLEGFALAVDVFGETPEYLKLVRWIQCVEQSDWHIMLPCR